MNQLIQYHGFYLDLHMTLRNCLGWIAFQTWYGGWWWHVVLILLASLLFNAILFFNGEIIFKLLGMLKAYWETIWEHKKERKMERGLKGDFALFGTSYTHVPEFSFTLGFEWVLYKIPCILNNFNFIVKIIIFIY